MKKLYRNTKINLLLIALFTCGQVYGRKAPIAIIDDIQGNVFVTNSTGTKKLKTGDHLSELDQIRTEVGAQVTFSDYYDHRYHLSGSGHIKLSADFFELRQGYLWLQSFNTGPQPFMLKTANSVVTYTGAELILSFDNYTGQSQLLVLKDEVDFANVLERERKYRVTEGSFSYIHKDYEHGTPRRPTPIGFKSYEKITSLFDNVKPMDKTNRYEQEKQNKTKQRRGIASVVQEQIMLDTIGKKAEPSKDILYVKKKEIPMLNAEEAMSLHQEKMKKLLKKSKPKAIKKKFMPDYSKKSDVVVKIYGGDSEAPTWKIGNHEPVLRRPASLASAPSPEMDKPKMRVLSARQPASVEPFAPTAPGKIKPENAFENSLIREYKQQMRHSTEVNSLIKDLQSYDQDYKMAY